MRKETTETPDWKIILTICIAIMALIIFVSISIYVVELKL